MIINFLKYYQPYKKILFGVIIGSLTVAILELIFPLLIRHILNEVLPQKDLSALFKDAGVLLVLYLLNYLLLYQINYHGHVMSAKIENDLRGDLFKHYQRMSFKFFDNNKSGQL